VIETRPIEPFGVQIEGDLLGTPAPADAAALRGLLAAHGLLVARGLSLSADEQARLTAVFGRLEREPNGAPLQMHVSNRRPDSSAPDGELRFHSDYAYHPQPVSVISLYGLELAPDVTPTLFASAAASRLPASLRSRLAGLDSETALFVDPSRPARERAPDAALEAAWSPLPVRTRHRALARTRLGADFVQLCWQHADRFADLDPDASDALQSAIFAVLYADGAIYTHAWQPQDLVIWDNLAVQHARPVPNAAARTLRRFHCWEVDDTPRYVATGRRLGSMPAR
jgi:alpha-ketoglutarate-dependent taurine dioxygenase